MALKVALVHDWLTNQGGGERVLWQLHQLYPEAPIYTSVFAPESLPDFAALNIKTSFLQNWPLAKKKHQLFSMFRTQAFESFDFSDYDLVISSTSSEAKGIITKPGTVHICYMFTPTRYYWSGYREYIDNPGFGLLNPIVKALAPPLISKLREWDYAAAQRPDYIVGISNYVNGRIRKYYRREPELIYPPVDIERFDYKKEREDFYIVVSRLIPYKRVELAVKACTKLSRRLIVIGRGTEEAKLKRQAGSMVEFVGALDDEAVADYYARAKGFIFTAEEDFGITPLEAMAAGCPVIAYGRGGATETVIEGETGTFFTEPSVDSVVGALKRFEAMEFNVQKVRRHAEAFSNDRFKHEIEAFVATATKKT